jgi:hypothetical protein
LGQEAPKAVYAALRGFDGGVAGLSSHHSPLSLLTEWANMSRDRPTDSLKEFFSDQQLRRAMALMHECKIGELLHQRLRDEVVAPAMSRINRVSGQQNSADHVAYSLEAALRERMTHWRQRVRRLRGTGAVIEEAQQQEDKEG